MNQHAKNILDRVQAWPEEDQAELAEARRSGVYALDGAEAAAIREALAQLDRGEGVSEQDMEAFWKRCGIR